MMNENVSSDLETITDNISNSEISVGEDFTSNHANETPENIPSRETETSELNAEEIVSGFSKENIEVACKNDDKEDPSQFESKTASVSFNSDSTAENSCVTAEGKFEEENSTPDLGNNNTDAVAGESLEGQLSEIASTKENPFLQSVKYLEKHQILRLFQNFAAQIVYKRPDNPLQYLVDELERSREGALEHAQVPAEGQESDRPDLNS